jgi:hypothetical protein
MNSSSPSTTAHVCPNCGALSTSGDGVCWLCYAKKTSENPYAPIAIPNVPAALNTSPPSSAAWDIIATILLISCLILTILLAIGMAAQDAGMLIPFAILVGPAYLVTLVRGVGQISSSGRPSPGKLFKTFMLSLVVTIAIIAALLIAAIILLILICLNSPNSFR